MRSTTMKRNTTINSSSLIKNMKIWSEELGFQQIGFSNIELSQAEKNLQKWLDMKFHGEMYYMEKHGKKRSRPEILVPRTLSIISVRMDYLSVGKRINKKLLDHPKRAYISRYALGRDYHKVLRKRLKILGKKIHETVSSLGYRVFVDSAPVLEKPIAEKAGLGWIGKHTNLINKESGSFFFLGEIYTDLSLPFKDASSNHCGSCSACIDVCPTKAIVAPYVIDARKCISYLTIELKGSIPEKYRKLIGNRIYGCDDCQIFCPWNKFAKKSAVKDFSPRYKLDSLELIEAFLWSKTTWQEKTEGTAIRRISHEQWLRNVAVAMGNAKKSNKLMIALESRRDTDSIIVKEHVEWAIQQHS